ncbi:MAG: BatA domain-containing protein, partial [Chthoniobacteraceae bacterium]
MDFVTPQWLAAAGAIAIPVFLHLIRSERFQRCELATVRFLAALTQPRGGRRRIANWPLLLVRAAALVAVASLLARPFQAGSEAAGAPGLETLVLTDVSGSQLRRDAPDLTRLAKDSISALPTDSRVTLARFAREVEVVPSDGRLQP